MAEEVGKFDKIKLWVASNSMLVIGVLVAFVAFLLFKMKKKNVKLFGR